MSDRRRHRVPLRSASATAPAAAASACPPAVPPLAASDRLWIELYDAWKAAQLDAQSAAAWWRLQPGRDAYAVYRAAQDRADAAQDALAGAAE